MNNHQQLVMVAVQHFGYEAEEIRWFVTAYDKRVRQILRSLDGNRCDDRDALPKTKDEALKKTVSLLQAAGIHGRLRLVGPDVCGYCGRNCTGKPFNAETACKGLRAAWRADQRAEARAETRAARRFEEAAYGLGE